MTNTDHAHTAIAEDASPKSDSPLVGKLITSTRSVPPLLPVSSIADTFFESANLDAVAVVDGSEPVGLITRPKLLLKLFRRFGFELFGKNPVITIADTDPLIIDEHERLDVAIEKALDRDMTMVYDEIIVVDGGGCFKGLLSIKQLVIQQSSALANSMVQKEIATKRATDLEKVSEMKSQFIANVTHELRSPVNAIIGLAELLRMAADKGSIEQVKERLSFMISSATGLRAIITNILDLSKIEAGKMDVTHQLFDVRALLLEVAETTRVLVGNKPVNVEVSGPAMPIIITSDPIKLRQIVINLTSNAAKFTDRGKIVLSLSLIGSNVVIEVSDTGIGIKQEHLDKLFKAFSQIEDAKTKKHDGTGLGLTISKSLVEIIGGSISLASTFGAGTTFTVTLPLLNMERGGSYVTE
jgi:signal transduction histidine kinase